MNTDRLIINQLPGLFPAHYTEKAPYIYHTAAGGNDSPFATAEDAIKGAKANVHSFATRPAIQWLENSTQSENVYITCTATQSKNGWYGQVTVMPMPGKAIKPAIQTAPPVTIRAYISGGVLQGWSSDNPEAINFFVWDEDLNDPDEASLFQMDGYYFTEGEAQRTAEEAERQAWTIENDPDPQSAGIDHKGVERRLRPPAPSTGPTVFEKAADLYNDEKMQPIE